MRPFFFCTGWNLGSLLMTLLAWLLRSWSSLQLSFAVGSLALVSYVFLIPESPRWLLNQGKSDQAEVVFRKIARINGVRDTTSFEANFQKLLKAKQKEESKERTKIM